MAASGTKYPTTRNRLGCAHLEARGTRRQAGTVALDADTTLVTRECGFACVAQESGFAFASVRSKAEGRAKNGDVSVASMATVYVSVYVPSRVSFVDSVLNLFEERHLRGVESVRS